MRPSQRLGFTLIELSIVLVIIGLIAGGVLVGKDLIDGAKIRKTISQKDKFDAAANTFRTKYNCLPGDCRNASQFGLGSGTSVPGYNHGNGNGDKVACNASLVAVAVTGGATTGSIECINFWHHLKSAALVEETWPSFANPDPVTCFTSGFHSPAAPITRQTLGILNCGSATVPLRGGWGLLDAAQVPTINQSIAGLEFNPLPHIGRSYMLLGGQGQTYGGNAIGSVTPNEMRAIDQKLDDGMPLTGTVFVVNGNMTNGASYPVFNAPNLNTCLTGSEYRNSTAIQWCYLVMKAGF